MALTTKPKALIKPEEGAFDTGFEVVGTKDGFLVAWTRGSSPLANEVLCQRFDETGKAVGKPVSLDGPRLLEGAPELVALGGGKVGVLWKATSDEGQIQLRSAVVDAGTGKASEAAVVVPERAASAIHDIAVLDNGMVALVTRSSFSGEDTTLQLLDKAMKPLGQPVVIEEDNSGPFGIASFEQTVVANGQGGVAFFRGADSQLKAVTFDGAGRPGKAVQVNTTEMPAADFGSYVAFNVKAEPLDGGGYVVTWMSKDEASTLNYDVYARVYGENGKPLGKDFIVNQEHAGQQEAPEILTFDKGFAVAWTELGGVGSLVEAQVLRFFDKAGRAVSEDIVSEDFANGSITIAGRDTEYARLPDGSYVKLFSGAGGAITADGVPAARFGTGKSDVIAGRATDEIILGGTEKDSLTGAQGADTLDGGVDDDRLEGGAGDDMMLGGAGDDLLVGGAGSDVFVFAPKGGKDDVSKFAGDDFIDVRALHYNRAADVLAAAEQEGKNVVFRLSDQLDEEAGGVVVKLLDVRLEEVSEAAILF